MFKNVVKLCRSSLYQYRNFAANNKIIDKSIEKTSETQTIKHTNPFATKSSITSSVNNKNIDSGNETPLNKEHINPFAAKTGVSSSINNENIECDNGTPLTKEEKETRLKVLQLEVDIASQEGRRVPELDFLKDQHWEHVLTLASKSARMKYYSFLWQVEMKKLARKRKKEEKAAEAVGRIQNIREERLNNDHIVYGLGHVSMFLRIYDTTINHWMNNRLIRAMQFSPKIVLDCSYDEYMTKREAENAAKQLMLCFAENRMHDDPFDLHYCNVNMESPCTKSLHRYIPTMMNAEFPMNVHQKCFTEIFPKENIVYLTPHCRKDLQQYNPDDVYVVGAMVDTVNNEPLSLAKAKRLGLRMARLPLDRYLQWGAGSGKSLTLNQMINIMLDLKKDGDWVSALRHVPRRKVTDLKAESERFHRALHNKANRCSVRLDRIMSDDSENTSVPRNDSRPNLRSHKENLEFNLSTWGSKRKERQR